MIGEFGYHVCSDGFVYLLIPKNVAINVLHSCYPTVPEICILHEDGSECSISSLSGEDWDELLATEDPVGIAVGYLSAMVESLQEARR